MIAETGLNTQSFAIDLSKFHTSSSMHDWGCLDASTLEPWSSVDSQIQFCQGWLHLRELCLQLEIQPDTAIWTREMIRVAPGLRKLSLRFNFRQSTVAEHVLDLDLPALEDLYLNGAWLSASTLLKTLRRSQATLQRLQLRSFFLKLENDDAAGTKRDWNYFFRALRSDFRD